MLWKRAKPFNEESKEDNDQDAIGCNAKKFLQILWSIYPVQQQPLWGSYDDFGIEFSMSLFKLIKS